MPPKSSNKDGQATSGSAPPSRRSARLTGAEPSHKPQEEEGRKRSATDKPTSGPASKKTKPASKPTQSKSNKSSGKHEETIPEKTEEEEKEAEAPANAEPAVDTAKDNKKGGTGSGKVLKVGDVLPKVTLKDEEGEDVDVSNLAGEKGVVMFLYPKANTPGCTNQACGFRDAFDEISELGYEVYGLSRDGPTAQKNWKIKQKLDYKLLCDPDSILIKRLGAFVLPKNTKRSSFIFEKGSGKLIEAKYGVKPADDPKDCLAFIKRHHK